MAQAVVHGLKSSTNLCLFSTSLIEILDLKAKLFKNYFCFTLVAYKNVHKIIVARRQIDSYTTA